MNEPIKVLVASPGYDGRFDVRFLESITSTIFLAAQHNIQVVPVYLCFDSLVQRVRNNYFRIAYNNNFDVLFFIDNDIGWNPQDFVNLVLSDKDMIGGGYRKKHDNEELYAFKVNGDSEETFEIVPDEDGILEVSGLGCGFLKLSKKCFTQLFETEEKYYIDSGNLITKMVCDCVVNDQNHFVSEDIVLGFKWKNLGGKVYVDTNIELEHVGNKRYTGNVKTWLSNWKQKFDTDKQAKTIYNNNLSNYIQPVDITEEFKVL
jgi:hypothetical protein